MFKDLVMSKDPPCVKGFSIDGNCIRDPLNRRTQGSGGLGQLGRWTIKAPKHLKVRERFGYLSGWRVGE